MLPMLPIYISYFAGQENEQKKLKDKIINVISFVLGFTLVFLLLGIFSATLGKLLKRYIFFINIILGIIVILFGLNFIGLLKIPFINKTKGIKLNRTKVTFASSFLFGIIFSISWSPCVGTFLGSALSLIIINGNLLKGILLILSYCAGLGVPFVISVLLIDKLKNTFNVIKKNYDIISKTCGIFLCIMGILIATGLINEYFTWIV